MNFKSFKEMWEQGVKYHLGQDAKKESVAKRKIEEVRSRMRSLDLWDEKKNQPVFGWAPVVFGWLIDARTMPDDSIFVWINGVSWEPACGEVSWTKATPWSEAQKV